MKHIRFISVSILLITILISCDSKVEESKDTAADEIKVGVSIVPYIDFVKRVGGEKVVVESMLPVGASPESYEILPDKIKFLANADIYVSIGTEIPFEKIWMKKIKDLYPELRIENSAQGIEIVNKNPHVWLGIEQVKKIINNIYSSLSNKYPEHNDYFKNNRDKFLNELIELDSKISPKLDSLKNKTLLVYHPAWGYFLNKFGIKEVAVEHDHKEPSVKQMQELFVFCKENNIKAVFVEPQFKHNSVYTIANQVGADVVFLDHFAEKYIDNILKITDNFIKYLN